MLTPATSCSHPPKNKLLDVGIVLINLWFNYRVSLREMMRRASSAARAVSGLDVREPEEGMAIPTLTWPPDPPPSYESVTRQGLCDNLIYFFPLKILIRESRTL